MYGPHWDISWEDTTRTHKNDLELIPSNLMVLSRLTELLMQIDKECNFSANYPKRHDNDFHD